MDDYESAAGYSLTDAGFIKLKVFHTLYKRGLGSGSARLRHDEIMRRPHIKALWDLCENDEHNYMLDLTTDTADGQEQPLPGNYGTGFWPAYRSEFLGQEKAPWHVAHTARFAKRETAQGSDSVSKYYEKRFMKQASVERSSADWNDSVAWASMTRVYDAHAFLANLDTFLKAKLMQDKPELVDPGKMPTWEIDRIYSAARIIEASAAFINEKKARDQQAQMQKAIHAVSTSVAAAASVNASATKPKRANKGSKHRNTVNATGVSLANAGTTGEGYARKNRTTDMSLADWDMFGKLKTDAAAKPHVPGWDGLTWSLKGQQSTTPKEGFQIDTCKSWRTGKGCGAAGHRVNRCKILYPSAPPTKHGGGQTTASANATTATSTATSPAFATDIVEMLRALGGEMGG